MSQTQKEMEGQKVKHLTPEDIKFIKNLSNEMKTQDNRGTAQPFGLILTTEKEEIRPQGCGDSKMARFYEESYYDFTELMDDVKEYYGEDNDFVKSITEEIDTFSQLEDSHEADNLDICVFDIEITNEPNKMQSNFFITEKAYHQYIAEDGHNLSKPQSYGIHLRRNSEMAKLYEIIHKIAEEL